MTIKEILGIEQDYHDEMDHEKYENYFETQICKNVSKNSALVIDNASYHSKYSEDHPKSTWKKLNIPNGLKKRKIPYAKDALRPTPWKLAKEKRENYPANRLEKIAYKYGHEIVRLPPYHCQLNPIELIWGIEKTMWHQKIKNINFQKLKTYSGRKEKK